MDECDQSMLQAVQWGALLQGFHHDALYLHGYVTTEAEVDSVLEVYRRVTATAFCVRTSSPLTFDPRRADMCRFSTRSFQFSKASNPQIGAEGVPFTHGGKRILECQFGPRREHERKRGVAEAPGDGADRDPGPAPNRRARLQRTHETRKKGCGAKITVLQICMLPDYAVTGRKMVKVLQINAKERLLEDLCLGRPVRVENRYYMDLPLPNAHNNHAEAGAGAPPGAAPTPTLHPQVVEWIGQLVAEGVTDPAEVQATLRHHVQTRMSNLASPSELDRAYYPRLADVKGHVSRAKARIAKQARRSGQWPQGGANAGGKKKPREPAPPPAEAVPEVTDLHGSHIIAMEPASYAIVDIKTGEPSDFELACESHVTDDAREDGASDGAASSLSDQESCPDDQEGCPDDQEGCPGDQGGCSDDQEGCPGDQEEDICSGTGARKKSSGHATTSVSRCRKRAHEELEVLRAMARDCTDGPALESLTQSIRALQHSFTQLLDSSSDEGPPPPPQTLPPPPAQPRKRKHAESDPAAGVLLPTSKAPAKDRGAGHSPRKKSGGGGTNADSAKMAAPQTC